MAIAITLSNGRTWRTKAATLSHFKAMLARYADGDVVEDRNDHDDLVALLERNDEAITDGPSKTGTGIDHFTRTHNNFNGYSTPSFWVHRMDSTATDFSFTGLGRNVAYVFDWVMNIAVIAEGCLRHLIRSVIGLTTNPYTPLHSQRRRNSYNKYVV